MTIDSHVCSLDLAKRLDELGVKQNSYFYWISCRECNDSSGNMDWIISRDIDWHPKSDKYAAYLSSELGDMLPKWIEDSKLNQALFLQQVPSFGNEDYGLRYAYANPHINNLEKFPFILDDNECNARAKMLIYLIENGLVKVEDINAT